MSISTGSDNLDEQYRILETIREDLEQRELEIALKASEREWLLSGGNKSTMNQRLLHTQNIDLHSQQPTMEDLNRLGGSATAGTMSLAALEIPKQDPRNHSPHPTGTPTARRHIRRTQRISRREAMKQARHVSNSSLADLLLALKLSAEEAGFDRRVSTNLDELLAYEMSQDSRQHTTDFVAGNHHPPRPNGTPTRPVPRTQGIFRLEDMKQAGHVSNSSLADLLLALRLSAEESGLDRRTSQSG